MLISCSAWSGKFTEQNWLRLAPQMLTSQLRPVIFLHPFPFSFLPFSTEKIHFWRPVMKNTLTAFQILSQIVDAF